MLRNVFKVATFTERILVFENTTYGEDQPIKEMRLGDLFSGTYCNTREHDTLDLRIINAVAKIWDCFQGSFLYLRKVSSQFMITEDIPYHSMLVFKGIVHER